MNQDDSKIIVLLESAQCFDYDAADAATHEEAMKCLKVLKHYVRVLFGSENVNGYLKSFLNSLGLEPEIPGSVVGGYKYALGLLKFSHQCTGRDCVQKYRQQESNSECRATRMENQVSKTKASVREQQEKSSGDGSDQTKASKKRKHLSYTI